MKQLNLQRNPVSRRRPVQTSGNQLLLKKISTRKRGVRNPRVIARKYGLLIKFLVIIMALCSIGYFSYKYIYLNPKFTVRNVSVVGGGVFVNIADFQVMVEQKTVGQSIFTTRPDEIEGVLKGNFLGARNIEVSIDYPDTLVLKIDERVPLALVSKGKNQPSFLIDVEGYILGEVSDEFMGLPMIIYDGEINVGSFLEDNIVPVSVEILSEAGKAGLEVSSVSFKERYSKLYLGPTEIFLSNSKDIHESVRTLERMYKSLLLEGKAVIKIDLRYDKVIVLYE